MAINKNDYLDVDGNYDLKKDLVDELIDGVNSDDVLTNRGAAPSDINQITQAGIYQIGGTYSNFIGSGSYYGFLTVKRRLQDSSEQLSFLFSNTNGETWVAIKLSNTMSSWYRQWSELNSNVMTESGSNPNGRYIRFSDGTQICYNGHLISSNNSADGTIVGFPANFSDDSYSLNASAKGMVSGSAAGSYVVESVPLTVSTFRIKILTHTPTEILASADTTTFGYIAIGRWK